MPATNIEQIWRDTYEANLRHDLQQHESLLGSRVMVGSIEGAKKKFGYIGAASMIEKTGKNAKTTWQDIDFYNRWLGRRSFNFATHIDKEEDIQKSLTDPTSDIVRAGVFAANRCKDERIIEAFDGTAYTGEDGTTAVAFDATNQEIGVQFGGNGSNTGLTLAKLRELRARCDESEVPVGEEWFLAVSPRAIQSLLQTTEASNQLYAAVCNLYDGHIAHFMGFTFVRHNMLPVTDSKVRSCFAWTRSAMQLGIANDVHLEGPTADMEHNWDFGLGVYLAIDATRLYDKAVFRVMVDEN